MEIMDKNKLRATLEFRGWLLNCCFDGKKNLQLSERDIALALIQTAEKQLELEAFDETEI